MKHSPAQERARASHSPRQAQLPLPIVTQVGPAAAFWPADDYRDQNYEERGMAPAYEVGAPTSMTG